MINRQHEAYRVTFRATYATEGTTNRVASTVVALGLTPDAAVTKAMKKLTGPIALLGLQPDSITVRLVKNARR